MLEVTDGDTPVGYIWFSPTRLQDTPDQMVIELHLCADPSYHGRWLTRRVLHDGFAEVVATGADWVIAIHKDAALRRTLKTLGFQNFGGFTNILNLRNYNGIFSKYIRRGQGEVCASTSGTAT